MSQLGFLKVSSVPTYRASIRCSGDKVVFKFEVRVEHRFIQLDLAIELIADFLPASPRT